MRSSSTLRRKRRPPRAWARIIHWGPRTLDLDIIFYDKLVYEDENLIIPHIDMQNRDFVLKPLAELCPNYRHPVFGKTVSQLLGELKER